MQEHEWEGEYRKPKLITRRDRPQSDTLKFLKFVRRQGLALSGAAILDVGSGTGRNANYLSGLGSRVIGLEISETAIKLAEEERRIKGVGAEYLKHDIGSPYPFGEGSFDIVLDVMSSNSLTEKEREIYVREAHRVLKPEAFLYVKALCKDGDQNAKRLLKDHPGPEKDTYRIPDWGLVERVWSKDDFNAFYSRFFDIVSLEKKTNYATYGGRVYKRNYWLAYLKKR